MYGIWGRGDGSVAPRIPNLSLDVGEWSASRIWQLYPRKCVRRKLTGQSPFGRFEKKENILTMPGLEPRFLCRSARNLLIIRRYVSSSFDYYHRQSPVFVLTNSKTLLFILLRSDWSGFGGRRLSSTSVLRFFTIHCTQTLCFSSHLCNFPAHQPNPLMLQNKKL